MFFAGDEFGNTQFGNNNAYCQDNMISWVDWNLKEKNKDLYEFFKHMIHFRHEHEVIRRDTGYCSLGFPSVSTHGIEPWQKEFDWESKLIGAMYAGKTKDKKKDDIVYVAVNAYWEPLRVKLPELYAGLNWHYEVDTYAISQIVSHQNSAIMGHTIMIGPRSAVVLTAR